MRLSLLALLALLAPAAAAQGPFTRVPVTLPQGVNYESVAPADYDGDGDLDLLVIRANGTAVGATALFPELYRNDGVGADSAFVFTEVPFPAPSYPAPTSGGMPYGETLSWADVDGDGDVDALVATNARTALYLNDGGVFTDSGAALPVYKEFWTFYFSEPASSAWGDVDNDGDLDLVLPRTAPGSTTPVLYENAGGTLTPTTTPFPRVNRDAQLTWGDVESDGDLDLLYLSAAHDCALSNPETGECLVIYENDGGALAPRPVDFPGFHGGAADFGDFDLDGDLDVLLVAKLDNPAGPPFLLNRAIVFRNDGATFTADTLAFPFAFDESFQRLGSGQWADYDSDGDVDILIGGNVNDYSGPGFDYGGVAFVFANDGGQFTLTAALPATESFGTSTWADLDGDGDLDFLATGERVEDDGGWATFARLYRNDTAAPNKAPTAPGALAASPTADGVALSWAPASDDHTPADALTYNLQVRHTNGSDIVSPMSRPGGGRMLPQPGNVSLNTAWSLSGLAPGVYTWSVQAVDNAFNGGPFAAEGTFTVGATAGEPGAAAVALAVGVAPNPAAGRAAVTVALTAPGPVRVSVFDALGREVAVVHDGPLGAGTHALAFDAAALPAGVYVVRATGAGVAASRTVTVVR